MSLLERLEKIRTTERLNKKQFEQIIEKSSGYIGTLAKTNSIPGTDVLIKISKNFPNYNIDWLLTGEGDMMKSSSSRAREEGKSSPGKGQLELETVRNEIRSDLKIILDGMTANFEVINDGILQGLKGQQKVLKFIEKMDQAKVYETAGALREYLKQHE